jgi:hypothetical protein
MSDSKFLLGEKNRQSSIREHLISILLPFVSVVLFFSVLELILWGIHFTPSLKFNGRDMPFWARNSAGIMTALSRISDVENRLHSDVYAYKEDFYLGYRLKSNLDIVVPFYDLSGMKLKREFPKWRICTDENGRRVQTKNNTSGKGSSDIIRVAFMGGSAVFGWGINYENTMSHEFNGLLDGAFFCQKIVVENYGSPGYALSQQLVLLKQLPPDCRLIILDATSNCDMMSDITDREKEKKQSNLLQKARFFMGRFRFFQLLEMGVSRWAGKKDPPRLSTERIPLDEYEDYLSQFIETAQARGISLVLLGLCGSKAYVERMRDIAGASGIPYLTMREILDAAKTDTARLPLTENEKKLYEEVYGVSVLKEMPSLYLLFPDMCHPNPTGHRVLADSIFRVLKEHPDLNDIFKCHQSDDFQKSIKSFQLVPGKYYSIKKFTPLIFVP